MLHPSRLGRGLSIAWLCVASTACAIGGSESLAQRLAVAAVVAVMGVSGIWGPILMRGPRAIGAIRWNAAGAWWVYLPAKRTWQAATVNRSTAQWGARWVWLGMSTPGARYAALIDRRVVDTATGTRLIWALRARRGRVHPASG
jgi:hypothetical protein